MPDITIPAGPRELPGYLAVPEGTGPWPAVVILFEAFGAVADMRAQADRFASRGYLAVLPDFYDGAPWVRCVRKAMTDMRSQRGPIYDGIEAARSWLAGRDDCTGAVGVAGFCMGGGFALVAAARYGFQAAAVNYGILPRHPEDALAGACPVVASYGGADRTLRGAAARLERALTVADVPHDVKEYPGTGHSFLTDATVPGPLGPVARVALGIGKGRENAADAWERVFAFFAEHVGGPPSPPDAP
ncbi:MULTISPECIES: dienelactone hydrolase family protein [Thermomonosporaceae]|uniref:dienelactone hydrolase family protein n=1 Tax=Thermomonosporaceae TaxID=2012 RepID=UPI00255B3DA9|nr:MULTISPECIES: dienelactone hydrolase family protein [Thermomonosporaceae]MDL4776432.1 dienelactone hydrolase family protein [Actinomadura xylanilytica]